MYAEFLDNKFGVAHYDCFNRVQTPAFLPTFEDKWTTVCTTVHDLIFPMPCQGLCLQTQLCFYTGVSLIQGGARRRVCQSPVVPVHKHCVHL